MNINKIAKVIKIAKELYHEGDYDIADILLDAFVEEMEMETGKLDRIIAHYDNGDDYTDETVTCFDENEPISDNAKIVKFATIDDYI